MKLVRFGPRGAEEPGLVDAEGHIRDLSCHIGEIGGGALPQALRIALDGFGEQRSHFMADA